MQPESAFISKRQGKKIKFHQMFFLNIVALIINEIILDFFKLKQTFEFIAIPNGLCMF